MNQSALLFAALSFCSLGICDMGAAAEETLRAPTDKPNIIFILVDDLGWQDVGYMGAKFYETPNIDQLAADGINFTEAYSSGPNCAPTRACLFWHFPLYLWGIGLDFDLLNGKTTSWRGFPSTSMVRGQYKMIQFLEDKSFALYDLSKDAGEQNNIIDSMPELASRLKKEMSAWQKETNAPIPSIPNPECILE